METNVDLCPMQRFNDSTLQRFHYERRIKREAKLAMRHGACADKGVLLPSYFLTFRFASASANERLITAILTFIARANPMK
jgi:hypothetical protein